MLTVTSLTKSYGDHVVVDDLTFVVPAGRVTGFVGPNGAGKSTTMRMMVGLTRPDHGDVRYGDVPYHRLPRPGKVVGAALSAAAHPGRTARDHLRSLAAAGDVPRSRIDEVLADVGLTAAADQRVGGFSLGMGQRLALAAAVLNRPDVLLLDEPANGLDPDGIRWLRRFLRSYADAGGAVFVSSHLIAELSMFADDVVVIGGGRLLAAAPIDEIMQAGEPPVLVETPDAGDLCRLLEGNGLVVERTGHTVRASGTTRSEVAQLALDHHLRLDRLTDEERSLEDILVDLTAHAADFASGSLR